MTEAALNQGRPKLAFQLSEGLLQADPKNGQAHYFQALALASLRDNKSASAAAARAFRFADRDIQRYQAAQLAAQLTYADERYTLSQFWLRRAVHYAPNDKVRERSVMAFRKVRNDNPLSFQLRFSVTPSDNVNNGSNSPYNLIEGSPLVGTLSPSAQAISGLVASTDLRAAYRFLQSETYETRVTGRITDKRVRFNDPVTGISGDDLAEQRVQIGLAHRWSRSKQGYWQAEINGGRQWYGGDPLYDFIGLGFSRVQKLTKNLRLTLGTAVEEQFDEAPPIADATSYTAYAGLSYALMGGSRVNGSVHFREIDSNGTNRASQQWYGVASYTHGRKIGPATMSVSLGYSTLDYEQYSVIFPVAGGRVDTSWFGGVSAAFNDYSYMGFVPTLSVHTEKSRSNISRFDVDQTSVSLGIRSEF